MTAASRGDTYLGEVALEEADLVLQSRLAWKHVSKKSVAYPVSSHKKLTSGGLVLERFTEKW